VFLKKRPSLQIPDPPAFDYSTNLRTKSEDNGESFFHRQTVLRLIEVSAQETESFQDVTDKNTPRWGCFDKPINFKTVKKTGLRNIGAFCGCLLLLFVITCYSQISCIALPLNKNNVR